MPSGRDMGSHGGIRYFTYLKTLSAYLATRHFRRILQADRESGIRELSTARVLLVDLFLTTLNHSIGVRPIFQP